MNRPLNSGIQFSLDSLSLNAKRQLKVRKPLPESEQMLRIADASNLGWKLAALLPHGGADELLETYNEERHALRLSLEKAQFNSLKYTTLLTPKVMQAAFRVFAETLLNHGGEYKMAQAFSELMIDTRKSSLHVGHGGG